jgi:hypothetical protein
MSDWTRYTRKMRRDHGWTSLPGHKIFVADAGAVRFDYPQSWVVVPDDDSVKLHDQPPPDDNCRLAVSFMRLPPFDFSGLKLSTLVEGAHGGDKRPVHSYGPIREGRRGDLEWAWREVGFVDPAEKREARSRLCIARRKSIQALITFDFWSDDLAVFTGVWDNVLETLRLAEYIEDPTRGPTED